MTGLTSIEFIIKVLDSYFRCLCQFCLSVRLVKYWKGRGHETKFPPIRIIEFEPFVISSEFVKVPFAQFCFLSLKFLMPMKLIFPEPKRSWLSYVNIMSFSKSWFPRFYATVNIPWMFSQKPYTTQSRPEIICLLPSWLFMQLLRLRNIRRKIPDLRKQIDCFCIGLFTTFLR